MTKLTENFRKPKELQKTYKSLRHLLKFQIMLAIPWKISVTLNLKHTEE